MLTYQKKDFEGFDGELTPLGIPKNNYIFNETSEKYTLNIPESDKESILESSGVLSTITTLEDSQKELNTQNTELSSSNSELNKELDLLKSKLDGKDQDYQKKVQEAINLAVSDKEAAYVKQRDININLEKQLEQQNSEYANELEERELKTIITDTFIKLKGIKAAKNNVIMPLITKNNKGKRRLNFKDGGLVILDKTLVAEMNTDNPEKALESIIRTEFKESDDFFFAFYPETGAGGNPPSYSGGGNAAQLKSELDKLQKNRRPGDLKAIAEITRLKSMIKQGE